VKTSRSNGSNDTIRGAQQSFRHAAAWAHARDEFAAARLNFFSAGAQNPSAHPCCRLRLKV